jgi:hypothetical protein
MMTRTEHIPIGRLTRRAEKIPTLKVNGPGFAYRRNFDGGAEAGVKRGTSAGLERIRKNYCAPSETLQRCRWQCEREATSTIMVRTNG